MLGETYKVIYAWILTNTANIQNIQSQHVTAGASHQEYKLRFPNIMQVEQYEQHVCLNSRSE